MCFFLWHREIVYTGSVCVSICVYSFSRMYLVLWRHYVFQIFPACISPFKIGSKDCKQDGNSSCCICIEFIKVRWMLSLFTLLNCMERSFRYMLGFITGWFRGEKKNNHVCVLRFKDRQATITKILFLYCRTNFTNLFLSDPD